MLLRKLFEGGYYLREETIQGDETRYSQKYGSRSELKKTFIQIVLASNITAGTVSKQVEPCPCPLESRSVYYMTF